MQYPHPTKMVLQSRQAQTLNIGNKSNSSFLPFGVTIAGFKNLRRKNPPIRELMFVSQTSGYFS